MSESLEKANLLSEPLIPPSRTPPKPKLSYRHGRIPHLIAILALCINLALLIFAYAGSAAVTSSSSTSSMADATYMFIAHRPFEVDGKQLDDRAVQAIPRYGLSPFKACKYTMLKEDLTGNGTCTGSEWALKGDLGGIDKGDEIVLSDALAHVFPWASHLIIIMVLLNLYHLYLLIQSYRTPIHHALLTLETYPTNINHTTQYCVDHRFVERTKDKESKNELSYAHVRYRKAQALYIRLRTLWPQDFWVAPVSDGLGAVLGIVLVCAYSQEGEGEGKVVIDAGPALYAFLIAMLIKPLLVGVGPWLFGLKVYMGRNSQKNYQTGCFSAYNGKGGNGPYP